MAKKIHRKVSVMLPVEIEKLLRHAADIEMRTLGGVITLALREYFFQQGYESAKVRNTDDTSPRPG